MYLASDAKSEERKSKTFLSSRSHTWNTHYSAKACTAENWLSPAEWWSICVQLWCNEKFYAFPFVK